MSGVGMRGNIRLVKVPVRAMPAVMMLCAFGIYMLMADVICFFSLGIGGSKFIILKRFACNKEAKERGKL